MEYSKKRRKEIADAFINAKMFLDDGTGGFGKEEFICSSIMRSGWHFNTYTPMKSALKIIKQRLGIYDTVPEFLVDNLKIQFDDISYVDLQTYRHRWLDSLIEEFSN